MLDEYKNAKRLVIKIGSALLIKDGAINRARLVGLAQDIDAARKEGREIIVVSSGALALGCARLGLGRSSLSLEQSQAAAATGQIALVQGWQEALGAYDIDAAQILLTFDNTEEWQGYLNARGTLQSLIKMGVVPIINENDTVATQELRYGDNDRLAARVANMISAECLVLLSDVDGLYTKSPKTNPDEAEHIARVENITDDILAMGGESDSTFGSGGMITKLAAAKIATEAGCHMILTSGRTTNPLAALEAGKERRNTIFVAKGTPAISRAVHSNWVAGRLTAARALTAAESVTIARGATTHTIASGAEKALRRG
ncbi:MAG: glutamate 5-kinase [Alphaproteobacteria bacterium]|nr:glutamate 5-kinase [Alphaproteobacteria bacterium]MBE8220390.1 glutamate 5-kinase [Alphaproteobacteria bacterium]